MPLFSLIFLSTFLSYLLTYVYTVSPCSIILFIRHKQYSPPYRQMGNVIWGKTRGTILMNQEQRYRGTTTKSIVNYHLLLLSLPNISKIPLKYQKETGKIYILCLF